MPSFTRYISCFAHYSSIVCIKAVIHDNKMLDKLIWSVLDARVLSTVFFFYYSTRNNHTQVQAHQTRTHGRTYISHTMKKLFVATASSFQYVHIYVYTKFYNSTCCIKQNKKNIVNLLSYRQ